MIDLHSHILPGIDDGATSLEMSAEMARMYVADGVEIVACTPHILPGVYQNSGPAIRQAVEALQQHLDTLQIPLRLVVGCDAHVVPDFVQGLQRGHILALHDSRFVLVEPPHNMAPPRFEELFFGILVAGYVPVLTHPERLSWIKDNYEKVQNLAANGVWMQITAGSLTGAFGKRPQYWAERMLDEGIVHILATDAHDTVRRPPVLSRARDVAAHRIGEAAALDMVATRPIAMLNNLNSHDLPPLHPPEASVSVSSRGENSFDVSSANATVGLGNGDEAEPRSISGRLALGLRRLFK